MDAVFADTNALIRLLGGDTMVAELTDNKLVFISEMTEMEMLCKPNINKEQRRIIRSLLDDCVIVPFSPEIKQKAIKIRLSTRLKLVDAIVGATAINMGFNLITNDLAFASLDNLLNVILLPNLE
ncbi:PIN domain-containing protein [Runella sp. SP2]|uniref:PIN domain-containing protein n=1 Tax=Runella sp. SP2 TaxID=2268026 RepID=UPI000F07B66C|nr:PIN domain-containing protein [Runella sp. SP2]AYQ34048.1 PIN domain-containing protein [Runella sp. SP2]